MSDLSRFLTPVSEANPCGLDITQGPLMAAIRAALRVRFDRKTVVDESGNRREEAIVIDTDWRRVRTLCEEGLEQSRHLEVCVNYAAALLEVEGLAGAAAGIELIDELIHLFWPSIFPLLDTEEDGDFSHRVGLIENLSSPPAPSTEDPVGFVRRLSRAPLCRSRVGVVSLADFKDGRIPAPGTPEAVPVQGAFAGMIAETGGAEALAANQVAVELMVTSIERIKSFFANLPAGRTPDFDLLLDTLKRQRRVLDVFAGENSDAMASNSTAEVTLLIPNLETPSASSPPVNRVNAPLASFGGIQDSADVIRLLDAICTYYTEAEPSSPVPLLLQRARRLVGRSFLEVIGDLSANSMDDIRKIAGENPVTQ